MLVPDYEECGDRYIIVDDDGNDYEVTCDRVKGHDPDEESHQGDVRIVWGE